MRRRKRSLAKKAAQQHKDRLYRDIVRDKDTGLTTLQLRAPQVFNLRWPEARSKLLIFLSEIKTAVLIDRRRVYIDFSQTIKMISDGTLLFYAELYRLTQATKPKRMISCSYPKDEIVTQVLQQVGILGLLGKSSTKSIDHETVKHWHTATGTKVNGEEVAPILEFYEGTIALPIVTSALYGGLVEAMSNCRHHAYPEDRKRTVGEVEEDPRWWMFSQEREGMLSVAFCDLGIGIPTSLAREVKWTWSLIRLILAKMGLTESDGSLVRAAFELGRSQTGEAHRGKGLQNIREVLDYKRKGNLMVQSGRGLYIYQPNGLNDVLDFPQSIPGTLITWSIPINNEGTDEKHDHN